MEAAVKANNSEWLLPHLPLLSSAPFFRSRVLQKQKAPTPGSEKEECTRCRAPSGAERTKYTHYCTWAEFPYQKFLRS